MGAPAARTTDVAVEARGRQRRVRDLVFAALAAARPDPAGAAVLDCGGGSGRLAVALARAGAHVTVVDTSADALAVLRRRVTEAGVVDLVQPVQADVETMADTVPATAFDLAIVHNVLEVVDRPDVALAAVARSVRPDGRVSIVATNPAAAVIARALAGDLSGATAELQAIVAAPGTAGRPAFDALSDLCHGARLVVEESVGIGVFEDLVPGARVDAPGAQEALDELEAMAAAHPPFRDIATWIHVQARPRSADEPGD